MILATLKNIGVTRLTVSCGIAVLLGSGGPATASDAKHYSVVLGSYDHRNIAFRELRALKPTKKLHLRVLTKQARSSYQVIDGPYENWRQVNDRLKRWGELGVSDAWLINDEQDKPLRLAASPKT